MIRLLLLFAFSLTFHLGWGQSYVTVSTAKPKAKKAYDLAIDASMGARWDESLIHLEKALKVEPTFIDALIEKGGVYFEAGQYPEALTAFQEALDLGPDYDPFTWYKVGVTQMRLERFADAVSAFEIYLDNASERDRARARAIAHLKQCRFSAEAMANPVPFSPMDVGSGINTPAPEYLPSLTADAKTMVFTRVVDRQEDLFYSLWKDGAWQEAMPLEEINTPYNEGAHTISADGRFILFTACNREDGLGRCDLYFSEFDGNRWSSARNIGSPINTAAWESQPSLSANGKQLLFVSDRPGGKGKNDIWISERQPDGNWGTPRPLSDSINTVGFDQSPFFHPDGQTLYFMSDGHQGMGKTDLFYSRLQPDGQWGKPINLGYPINTAANEGALVVSLDGREAYFATDRAAIERKRVVDIIPNSDIFAFDLYEGARPQAVTYLEIKITDKTTGQPLSALAEIIDLETRESFAQSQADAAGRALLCLPAGKNFALNINRPGYLFFSENFALADSFSLSRPFEMEAALEPIEEIVEESEPILLRNVFFATGSAELLSASQVELDRLVSLLQENPEVRIRITGHTDDVGSEEDNLQLSEARAASVKRYLVEAGIPEERLESRGLGESTPIADNSSAEGRKQNRRTEFVLLK